MLPLKSQHEARSRCLVRLCWISERATVTADSKGEEGFSVCRLRVLDFQAHESPVTSDPASVGGTAVTCPSSAVVLPQDTAALPVSVRVRFPAALMRSLGYPGEPASSTSRQEPPAREGPRGTRGQALGTCWDPVGSFPLVMLPGPIGSGSSSLVGTGV